MANQATSRSDDLMVGAGTLFFARSDDPNGLHHLGNVSEFNINTDITTVDKNSAMNKDRELMASVVTAVNPTGSITMNEYNPYNLALGLYGREGIYSQTGGVITNQAYTVDSVPGIIELRDANGNRYMNVTGVAVDLATATAATFEFTNVPANYSIDTSSVLPRTVVNAVGDGTTTITDGGSITVTANGPLSDADTVMFQIDRAPSAPGDLSGMVIDVMGGGLSGVAHVAAPGGSHWDYDLPNGSFRISFDLENNTSTSTEIPFPRDDGWFTVLYTPSITTAQSDTDYIADEHLLRGGVIQIPSGSRFTQGQQIFVSFTAPEQKFVTVSGADAGEIQGRLLFIGDPNIGGQYTIEGWKVKITPDGDLTGLIGEDFGEFTLQVRFLSDKANHPQHPYYQVTINGRADGSGGKSGVYDPEY